jgi:hypothetical protein
MLVSACVVCARMPQVSRSLDSTLDRTGFYKNFPEEMRTLLPRFIEVKHYIKNEVKHDSLPRC